MRPVLLFSCSLRAILAGATSAMAAEVWPPSDRHHMQTTRHHMQTTLHVVPSWGTPGVPLMRFPVG